MKHARIGTKITIGFVLMLLPLLAVGIMSFKALHDVRNTSLLYADVEKKAEKVGELQGAIGLCTMKLNEVINRQDLSKADNYRALHHQTMMTIDEVDKAMSSPESKQAIARIRNELNLADVTAEELLAASDLKEAGEKMEVFNEHAVKALAEADRLQEFIREYAGSLGRNMDTVGKRTNMLTTLVLALSILACLGVIAWLRANIIKPSKEAFQRFTDTSQHLTNLLGEAFAGSEHLNRASMSIASALGELSNSAELEHTAAGEVDDLVEQIAMAINQVAQGAHEQSTDANEINNMMGQFKSAIERVVENAMTVAQYASESLGIAESSRDSVSAATHGIEQTKDTVLASAAKIQELGEKSKQIGEIIEVIDDIAEQTNLLALNAAIEAARAGEHGKGFAVVADEVRKLAERSAKATGEIADLIKGIQSETLDAVSAMEQGTQEVASGSELTKKIGASIDEMTESIEEVMMQISTVRAACNQMTAISETVVKSVADIASVTVENTALTQQVAASAESVSRAVEGMSGQRESISSSIQEISMSAGDTSASVNQMTASLQQLEAMSKELDKLTGALKW